MTGEPWPGFADTVHTCAACGRTLPCFTWDAGPDGEPVAWYCEDDAERMREAYADDLEAHAVRPAERGPVAAALRAYAATLPGVAYVPTAEGRAALEHRRMLLAVAARLESPEVTA